MKAAPYMSNELLPPFLPRRAAAVAAEPLLLPLLAGASLAGLLLTMGTRQAERSRRRRAGRDEREMRALGGRSALAKSRERGTKEQTNQPTN
eukprot:scaffold222068_cov35-Tisochrysis_lutea.AAC.1